MPSASSLPRTMLGARVVSAPVVLGAMVVLSALVQTLASWSRTTPAYLPDEYLYAQLARSIGNGDGVSVLHQSASLPAMLEPLLTAGFWSLSDAETSLHLTQAFHAFVMSLAVIPVYLIARRLRLSTTVALLCAALALVSPALVYASYVTADAVGFLLALVAVHAGVRACASPTVVTQGWFLVVAGTATFARLQYVTLFVAFAFAALAVERFHPLRAVRRFPVTAAVYTVAIGGGLALGGTALGRYEAITGFGLSGSTGEWVARTTALLLAVTGAAIAPGAVAWAVTRVGAPEDRNRVAFAALTVGLTGGLVLAAAIVSADTNSDRFLERYLLFAFPLVAIAFFCWIDEGRPGRVIVIAACSAVIIAAARVPVAGDLLGQASADSPTLRAVSRLGGMIGLAEASLVAALLVSGCAALAFAAALTRRIPAAALVAPTVLLLALATVGAHAAEARSSSRAFTTAFAHDAAWVEAARPGPTLLVQTPDSNPYIAMITTIWNPSIQLARPLGTERIVSLDGLSDQPVSVGRRGVLTGPDGQPVRGSVLFATGGSEVVLAGAARVVRDKLFTLAIPRNEPVTLRAFAAGVRSNRTVASSGWITAYPTSGGGCTIARLRLTLPDGLPPTVLEVTDAAGHRTTSTVRGGGVTTIAVRSTPDASRTVRFEATEAGVGTVQDGFVVTTVANGVLSAADTGCGVSE